MSCLTRKLQQNLTRYLKRNSDVFAAKSPECIREELVDKGICPSDVTTEQLKMMMKSAFSC